MPKEQLHVDDKTLAVFVHKGYEVTNILGKGAFGHVYRAIRMDTGEPAAVKVSDFTHDFQIVTNVNEIYCLR